MKNLLFLFCCLFYISSFSYANESDGREKENTNSELITIDPVINLPEVPNSEEEEDSYSSLILIGITLVLLFFLHKYKKSLKPKE